MSNLNIYQIEQEYINIAQQIIDADGEVTPELEAQLAVTQEQLEHKGRGYGFVIKQMDNEIDIIDSEIKRLQGLKGSRNKVIERMKEALKNSMEVFGISEIKSPTLKINFRKSETVEVETAVIAEEWCTIKTTLTPDKAKIKEALKRGETILGAELVQHNNLQIK